MKNLKWFLITLLCLNAGRMIAQKSDTTKSHRHGQHMAYDIPNLTEDQKKKIKDLKTPMQKEILPLKNQLSEKKAHLKTLQTAEKADLKSINSTIDEMTQLQSQIMKKHAAHIQAVRALLTDEQRIAFDTRANHGKRSHQYYRGYHRGMRNNNHGKRG
jgi:Spy/CpxP family protein refolding chaperone